MDQAMRDLIEMIDFTARVAVKTHEMLDEAEVYRIVCAEFAKAKEYDANIVLLTDDGSKLRVAATSLSRKRIATAENATGLTLAPYRIDLDKSSIWSKVVREGKTVTTPSGDILAEYLPRPLVDLILKLTGYANRFSIMAPLRHHDRIVGAVAVSCSALHTHVVPSVENLAQHISSALSLAEECAQRRLAEERLRESEEKYHSLFETVPVGIYRTMPAGQILEANGALVRMLGYPNAESLSQVHVGDTYVDPDDRQRWQARMEREGTVVDFEVQLRRMDGTTFWAEDSARVIRDVDGVTLYYQGVVKDITERRQLEEHQRRSIETTRTLLDGVGAPSFLIDLEGTVITANKALANALGKSLNELSGTCIYDALPPDEARVKRGVMDEVVRSAQPVYGEEERAGRYFSWGAYPVLDAAGKVERAAMLASDVTEHKRLEQQLSESANTLQALLNAIPEATFLMDTEGILLAANEAMLERLGSIPGGGVGSCVYDLLPPDVSTTRKRHVDEAIRTRRPVHFEDMRAGRYLDNYVYPVCDADGKVVSLAVLGWDITERRRAEAQLMQSAKMASLGVMAGGIAHQVRNPLGIISAFAQLLIEHPDDVQLRSQCVQKICNATQRASDVIGALLRFAHPDRGPLEELDIQPVLHEALGFLSHRMALQNITLHTKFQPDLPKVHGSRVLLEEAFLNLMLNACAAMPEGGTLTVITRGKRKDAIEVQVQDTGHGIPQEHLPNVFDPFFTTMPAGDSIGLGLAISHAIIERHKGTIEVRSKVDKGTTFTIRLPIAEGNAANAP